MHRIDQLRGRLGGDGDGVDPRVCRSHGARKVHRGKASSKAEAGETLSGEFIHFIYMQLCIYIYIHDMLYSNYVVLMTNIPLYVYIYIYISMCFILYPRRENENNTTFATFSLWLWYSIIKHRSTEGSPSGAFTKRGSLPKRPREVLFQSSMVTVGFCCHRWMVIFYLGETRERERGDRWSPLGFVLTGQ